MRVRLRLLLSTRVVIYLMARVRVLPDGLSPGCSFPVPLHARVDDAWQLAAWRWYLIP